MGMLVIGDVDYLTGYRVSLLIFYILPVGLATIYVGPWFAGVVAILSVAISIGSDFLAGMPYSEAPVLYCNATIALIVFVVAIGLLEAWKRVRLRRG